MRVFQNAVRRRSVGREPVAYITGVKGFRHLDLHVDARVLIPRPETETLVEAALGLPQSARVVDVGTGSGAVALALKDERPDLAVTATDVSEEALAVARANAARLGLDVRFARADLLDGVGEVDAVVSNPPYVEDGAELAPEIARHEPAGALYAGLDGLDVVRRLVAQAGERGVAFLAARGRRRPGARRRGARARRRLRARRAPRRPGRDRTGGGRVALTAADAQTFERCIAVGGIAVFPADTVYGLACEPDSKEAVQRLYMLKRRRPDKPAAVMFFALDLALAALPELGPADGGRAARAAAGRRDRCCCPTRRAASRWRAGRMAEVLGLRVPAWPPALAALADVRWPVLQSSANAAGGPDARRLDGGARVHARPHRPRPRRRRAAGHAVDGRRPARLRGATGEWSVAREGAMSVTEVAARLESAP